MKISRTYVLVADQKVAGSKAVVDIDAEVWGSDGSWGVGERDKRTGSIVFNHRTYPTLAEVCRARGLDLKEVRRRVVPIGRS